MSKQFQNPKKHHTKGEKQILMNSLSLRKASNFWFLFSFEASGLHVSKAQQVTNSKSQTNASPTMKEYSSDLVIKM